MKRKKIKNLCSDAVDVKPVNVDGWSEGYGTEWNTIFPDVENWNAGQCSDWLTDHGNNHVVDDLEELREDVREAMLEEPDYCCPMMNYYYPLPNFRLEPGEAQTILELHAGAVVLALVDEEPVLALSGGGMDLSWDICEAFMLLGYLPPVHFCDLPEFAGLKWTEKTRWILAGCRQSLQVATHWNRYKLKKLRHVSETLKANK